jgi:hypothetical protein
LHDDRTRDHEFDQFAKERPLAVDGVKPFGLFARHVDAL